MVLPLARLLADRIEPETAELILQMLMRFRRPALAAAVPHVTQRLLSHQGIQPVFAIRVLGRAADPRAQDTLRFYIADDKLPVALAAAQALLACGDKASARLLAERLPATIADRRERAAVAAALEFVHANEPDLGERIVRQRYLDDSELMQQRPWLRRLRN
ncbi:MAG: hypothetical protein AB8H80_07150 [Planctomycetota bacterium]